MRRSDFRILFRLFISWRVLLFVFAFLAVNYLALQEHFLGGGMERYLSNPYFWGFTNFDGEHFVSIARVGYQPLQHFFFPVYPILIGFVGKLFNGQMASYVLSGLLISHVSLVFALLGLWKLVRLDFKRNVAQLSILLLLVFPTSFYFASVYSESLFLAVVVWSFYFARNKKWLLAGILGAVATATRIMGIALIPALVVEAWIQTRNTKENFDIKTLVGLMLPVIGILAYMYYLNNTTGDPLEFFNTVSIFGEQRSTALVLLPQVFYRYVFKILPSLDYSYFPVLFTTWLEFVSASVFTVLTVLAFFRFRTF